MCSKSSVSTTTHSSAAPLQRLRTTEGTPHKLSQKSKMSSSTLQKETREITQDGVNLAACWLCYFPQIPVFIYSNREKTGFLTKITIQTNRKQCIWMPNTQHLLSQAPGLQHHQRPQSYFSSTQDLAVSVSSSLFHVKIKTILCCKRILTTTSAQLWA